MALPRRLCFAAAVFALGATLAAGCNDVAPEPEPKPQASISSGAEIPDPPELDIKDTKVGEGTREVKKGDKIKVHYVGKLLRTNFKFDSNESKDKPFEFTVGEGVIEGWSQGVIGMKAGGKRELKIPSRLAYGERGSPPKIPANAPLFFEIELLGFSDEAAPAPSGSASAGPAASASAGPAASASAGPAPSAKAGPASSAAPNAPKK